MFDVVSPIPSLLYGIAITHMQVNNMDRIVCWLFVLCISSCDAFMHIYVMIVEFKKLQLKVLSQVE